MADIFGIKKLKQKFEDAETRASIAEASLKDLKKRIVSGQHLSIDANWVYVAQPVWRQAKLSDDLKGDNGDFGYLSLAGIFSGQEYEAVFTLVPKKKDKIKDKKHG